MTPQEKTEIKLYGEDRAQQRKRAEELFSDAMHKVTHMVTEKKKRIPKQDYKEYLANLKKFALATPQAFWDKVEEEMAKAGAVGIENLFELAPANLIRHKAFQEAMADLTCYGMELSFPVSKLATDIFYTINHNGDPTDMLMELEAWVPEGWEESQMKEAAGELSVSAKQPESQTVSNESD